MGFLHHRRTCPCPCQTSDNIRSPSGTSPPILVFPAFNGLWAGTSDKLQLPKSLVRFYIIVLDLIEKSRSLVSRGFLLMECELIVLNETRFILER